MFAALMAQPPDHIYFKDLASRFVWLSDSLARSLGRMEQNIGRPDENFF